MLDLEKMKSAAMAANTRDHNENPDWYSEDDLLGFAYYPKNARFISAVSPSAVLELIERLEKAEQDAKRIDAIESGCCDIRCETQSEDSYGWAIYEHHMAKPHLREIGRSYREYGLREAIDAAMKEQA